MSKLPPEVRASYVVIIDSILAASDLQTITSKSIRTGLQKAVDYDITPQKDDIKKLIHERFDKYAADRNAAPVTNGHAEADVEPEGDEPELEPKAEAPSPPPYVENGMKNGVKRRSDSEKDDEMSDVPTTPPPKKKRKPEIDEDAAYAARLQAEENSRARSTRGGASRKNAPVKKKTPKKKTASKVKAEDDSDLDGSGSGPEKKVNRSGGFHKPLTLSAPLSALLDGETQLSRPQTVKRIWAYVKERDLQDPKDKRLIRCDDALRAVFKSEKIHMFTMNKVLTQNLYDPEA